MRLLLILILFISVQTTMAQDAMKLYRKGVQSVQQKKYEDGIKALNKFLSLKPDYNKALYYKGFAFFKLEQYDSAYIEIMNSHPIENDDLNGRYYGGLAAYHLGRGKKALQLLSPLYPEYEDTYPELTIYLAASYFKNQSYQNAIEWANKAMRKFSSVPLVSETLAKANYEIKAYQEALKHINRLLYTHKENIEYLGLRSKINLELKNHQAAFNDSNVIKDLAPNTYTSFYLLGYIKEQAKDYHTAIKHYHDALKIDNNYEAINGLGNCFNAVNQLDSAIFYYTKSLRAKGSKGAYLGLGVALQKEKNYAVAIENYNQVLNLAPEDSFARNNRGSCYASLNQFMNAQDDYKHCIEHSPKFIDPYLNLAILYSKEKRYNEALKLSQKAIQINKDAALAHYLKALNNEALGNGNCADFKKAFDMGIKEAKSRMDRYCSN